MNKWIPEVRKTKIEGEYDIIIVGGGPAGIAAALAASRNGCRTLLVEKYGFLGGMWTAGLINPYFDYRNKGGIAQEIADRLTEREALVNINPFDMFDYEEMKVLLDRMLLDSGVELLFHSYFADVYQPGDTVQGIIVENKSGRMAFLANVVIDCSGDGDVAARAGAPFELGRESDGLMQPMTTMFKLGNIGFVQDYQRKENQVYTLMKEAMERDGLPQEFNYREPCILKLPGTRKAVVQMTHIRRKSGIDAFELTKAEIEGRQLVQEAVEFFRKRIPELKDVELDQTGVQVGVRETRRILGEYVITEKDIMEQKSFEDAITVCGFNIDIHQPDGDSQDAVLTGPYQIPYRCLVPRKVENLLVAGRCISGSFEAHSSYRVTGDCVAMGQAAGTAASIAVEDRVGPRKVDTKKLVDRLKAQKVRI